MTKISKKIGKMWKDTTGVSPIIAVILMVAITVVLAATIYVWVSGFGGGGGGASTALTLSQQTYGANATATGGYVVYRVQSVSGNPGWEDFTATIAGHASSISGDCTSAGTGGSASGEINAGDYVNISIDDDDTVVAVGNTVVITDTDSGSIVYSADITYKN